MPNNTPKPPEQSKSPLHPLLVQIEKAARRMNQGANPVPLETAALARAEADLRGVLAALQRTSVITRGQVDAVLRTDALRTRPFILNPEQISTLRSLTHFTGGAEWLLERFLEKFPVSPERADGSQNAVHGHHTLPEGALVLTATPMIQKLGGGVKTFAVCHNTVFQDYALVPLREDGKTQFFGKNPSTIFVLHSDVFGREDGSD